MSDNLSIYNKVREVPEEAKKPIQAGRLKGKTDINPMWRIKALTELFGPCGNGWGYVINKKWLEPGANGEVSAFVDIDLWYAIDGKKSDLIPGTGGSTFIAKESSGLHTDDDCYKKSLTDAISVAAKALGIGADVYWEADSTKYGGKKAMTPKEEIKGLKAIDKETKDWDALEKELMDKGTKLGMNPLKVQDFMSASYNGVQYFSLTPEQLKKGIAHFDKKIAEANK